MYSQASNSISMTLATLHNCFFYCNFITILPFSQKVIISVQIIILTFDKLRRCTRNFFFGIKKILMNEWGKLFNRSLVLSITYVSLYWYDTSCINKRNCDISTISTRMKLFSLLLTKIRQSLLSVCLFVCASFQQAINLWK